MEERKTYQPPLMTVSHVEVEEQLLGVSFTTIPLEDVDSNVNALGHEKGETYTFGYQNGDGSSNVNGGDGKWGITWE